MEGTNQSYLATEKIGKLMGKYAVPCIISLLVGALYNIVDQIFIANASYLGSYGNAANTVVFPLTVIALAVAVMIGDGCCAFVSLSLGKKEPADAKRSMGNAVLLTIVSSILLTAAYLIFSDQIIAMFGGTVNEETFMHSKEYFFWISLGVPFYMFGQAMNPVIRADGSPKFAMASTLAGAIINIILDPIFIFIFKWGMMGAAVATVAGQIVTAILAVWYLCHTKTVRRCIWTDAICSNPHGGCRHRNEIFSDRHIRRCGYGSRLYSDCRLQYGRRTKEPCQETFYQTTDRGDLRGHSGAYYCGMFPDATDRHIRCIKRKRVLYQFCRKSIPHLSLYDGICLHKQSRLHLPAGHGKSGCLNNALHGT